MHEHLRHPHPHAPTATRSARIGHTLGRLARYGAALSLFAAASSGCSGDPARPSALSSPDLTSSDQVTFATLFVRYFAAGTPGHCATAGCHADPGHSVWLCEDPAGCYQGLIDLGLIDADDPARSRLRDPATSPLTWINRAGGTMPLDAQGDDAQAQSAIEAWIAAGAPLD